MKLNVFAIALWMGISGQMAHARMGVWDTPVETREVPKTLSFSGAVTAVYDRAWYANIFDLLDDSCESRLGGGSGLQLVASGPRSIFFEIDGSSSNFFAKAKSTYIPIHYEAGELVHPYFVVETPGWVKFHVEVHRSGNRKTLRLWLIRGTPGQEKRVPILTAVGS